MLGGQIILTRIAALLLLLVVLTGCASLRAPLVLTTEFDAQAAAFINQRGGAKVSGQAFVRQNNGKLFRAVGTDVFLVPRTAYADERVAAIYADGKKPRCCVQIPEPDPLYAQYMRRTVASSGGSFSFDQVADGEYYIIAMIHLPSETMLVEFPILEKISVRGGRSVRVVMRGY